MDKETYEALKRIIKMYKLRMLLPRVQIDFEKVESWIEEVAKDYRD